MRVVRGGDGIPAFTVLKVTGSSQIFERILDGEAALARVPAVERDISYANYEFKLAGTETAMGRSCYVLQLIPRKQSKYLLEGRVWIDAATFAMVRLEGRPAASVSLWIGKPLIIQEFGERNGAWVATSSNAISNTRLLGTTQLTINRDYPTPLEYSQDRRH